MSILSWFMPFFNIVCLAGVIILSRFANRFWQLVIGIVLVVLGLVLGGAR